MSAQIPYNYDCYHFVLHSGLVFFSRDRGSGSGSQTGFKNAASSWCTTARITRLRIMEGKGVFRGKDCPMRCVGCGIFVPREFYHAIGNYKKFHQNISASGACP